MHKLKPVTPGELWLEEFLRPMGNGRYRLAITPWADAGGDGGRARSRA